MEKTIEKLIAEKLDEFTEIQIWIFLGIVIVFLIIQYLLQNYWFKARLTKLNHSLKQAEIKFSRHHQDQIEAYKKFYTMLYDYQYHLHALLLLDNENAQHNIYKKKIDTWLDASSETIIFYAKNRILFAPDVCAKVDKSIVEFRKFTYKIIQDKKDMNELEDYFRGEFMAMYGDQNNEMIEIIERINKIKKSAEFKEAYATMKELIDFIEAKYRQLTNA